MVTTVAQSVFLGISTGTDPFRTAIMGQVRKKRASRFGWSPLATCVHDTYSHPTPVTPPQVPRGRLRTEQHRLVQGCCRALAQTRPACPYLSEEIHLSKLVLNPLRPHGSIQASKRTNSATSSCPCADGMVKLMCLGMDGRWSSDSIAKTSSRVSFSKVSMESSDRCLACPVIVHSSTPVSCGGR
jgi:hypothetical protein